MAEVLLAGYTALTLGAVAFLVWRLEDARRGQAVLRMELDATAEELLEEYSQHAATLERLAQEVDDHAATRTYYTERYADDMAHHPHTTNILAWLRGKDDTPPPPVPMHDVMRLARAIATHDLAKPCQSHNRCVDRFRVAVAHSLTMQAALPLPFDFTSVRWDGIYADYITRTMSTL